MRVCVIVSRTSFASKKMASETTAEYIASKRACVSWMCLHDDLLFSDM